MEQAERPLDQIVTDVPDDEPGANYLIVVLRPDQLEAIREIVREEVRAAVEGA